MMLLADSHCHLNMLDLSLFENNMDKVIEAAKNNGVGYFLTVAVLISNYEELKRIAERYPNVWFSTGLHPNDEPELKITVEDLTTQAKHPKVIAIGETGLDYFRSKGDVTWQQERFITHIEAAKISELPLIVHTRTAQADTIAIMRQEKCDEVGGVMHCFTEDWEMAKAALDLNFYISFSGILTFKNATILQDVARKVPIDKILIETDSPYLAPNPFRGKPNHPALVRHVAEFLAVLRNDSFENIAENTTRNFFKLFNLNPLSS